MEPVDETLNPKLLLIKVGIVKAIGEKILQYAVVSGLADDLWAHFKDNSQQDMSVEQFRHINSMFADMVQRSVNRLNKGERVPTGAVQ